MHQEEPRMSITLGEEADRGPIRRDLRAAFVRWMLEQRSLVAAVGVHAPQITRRSGAIRSERDATTVRRPRRVRVASARCREPARIRAVGDGLMLRNTGAGPAMTRPTGSAQTESHAASSGCWDGKRNPHPRRLHAAMRNAGLGTTNAPMYDSPPPPRRSFARCSDVVIP